MSDLDDQGATRDARTISYLKEGIARRDKENVALKAQVEALQEIVKTYNEIVSHKITML